MIDTNNESQLRVYQDKLNILTKQLSETEYTDDKLKIVITANMFPTNKVVLPSAKESYIYKNPDCSLGLVVRDRIKKVDGINEYDDHQHATLKVQSKKYMPYNSKYVSVVYAAINGLYPDYYDTNFIIVDNFSHHAGNKSILSMRPETTLFTGEVTLSNEAVILINIEEMNDLTKKYPEIARMKIINFKGDAETALAMYLVDVGIIPEKMTKDFVADSPTSFKFYEFITKYANENKISLCKYEETPFYASDIANTEKLNQIYDACFYEYLLKTINIPKESYDDLFKRLCEGDSYDPDNLIILDGIIDAIGAVGLEEVVNGFNSKIDDMIKNNKYPINEEILKNEKIELF